MANTPDITSAPDQQSLRDFLVQWRAKINNNEDLSAEMFLGGASAYSELIDYFKAKPEIPTQLLALEKPEATQLIMDICSNPSAIRNADTPKAEQSMAQMREAEIVFSKSVPLHDETLLYESSLAKAREPLRKHYANQFARMESKVNTFVGALRNKRLYETPLEAERAQRVLTEKPIYGSLDEIRKETKRRILEGVPEAKRAAATRIVDDAFKETGFDQEIAASSAVATLATQAVLANKDVGASDIIVEAVVTGRSAQEAVNLARVSTVVRQTRTHAAGVESFGKATSEVVRTVFPKANLPAAGAQAWSAATKEPQLEKEMATRTGSAFSHEQFRAFVARGNEIASQYAQEKTEKATNVTVVDAKNYMEALLRHDPGASPDFVEELPLSAAYAHDHTHFHFEFESPVDWILRWGAKKEVGSAIGGAAKSGSRAAFQQGAIKFLGRFLPARLALFLGGWVGTALFVVWAGWDLIKKGVGSMVSGLAAGGIGSVRAASSAIAGGITNAFAPGVNYKDPLAASGCLVALGIPLLAFVIMAGASSWDLNVKRSMLQPGNIGGGGISPIIDCNATQTNPQCAGTTPPPEGVDCNATQSNPQCRVEACVPQKPGDCLWPTTGYITQGPHPELCQIGGREQTSHHSMDAIDIGAAYNTPVIAVKGGVINPGDWHSGCADQPLAGGSISRGCNGGWGNYIDITSPDGYVLRYSHLALQSMSLTGPGRSVTQGEAFARVDNNGNSTGSHLHFQVISGPGNIFSIVPLTQQEANTVNHCVNSSGDACRAACPVIRTSIN